jgi:type I restriction enzyme S subunit
VIPSHWVEASLAEVCTLVTDGTHHSPPNSFSGDFRYITAKNIRPWGLDITDVTWVSASVHKEIYARCPVEHGDVLYIKDGVTTGVAAVNHLREPFSMLSSVALLKPRRDLLDPGFLKHWLNSPTTYAQMTSDMTGSAIQRLVLRQIRSAAIPLPPLREQQRIASRLDDLLERVRVGRQRLDRVPAILKRFRQSVLAAATNGELTREWREDRPGTGRRTPWAESTLAELCVQDRVITYGVIKLGAEIPDGVPCLRTSNVRWLRIDVGGVKTIAPKISAEYGRTVLRGGEVLVNVRGTLGGVAVADQSMRGWNVSREVAVVPVDARQVLPRYLAFWVGADRSQRWLAGVEKGVTYTGINIEDLRTLPVSLPPLEEQQEIVRRVEELLQQADLVELRHQAAVLRLSEAPRAVLAKAFRGELVPQDPSEEPASVMLERVRAQRVATTVEEGRTPGRRTSSRPMPPARPREAPRQKRRAS